MTEDNQDQIQDFLARARAAQESIDRITAPYCPGRHCREHHPTDKEDDMPDVQSFGWVPPAEDLASCQAALDEAIATIIRVEEAITLLRSDHHNRLERLKSGSVKRRDRKEAEAYIQAGAHVLSVIEEALEQEEA